MHWLPDHDEEVCEWAGNELGVKFVRPLRAFGILDDGGTLKGAAVFNDYYPGGNVELTFVGRGTLSRRVIQLLADYAFNALDASRVTAKTKRRNSLACKILPRIGFAFETIQKRYFGPEKGDDAVVYVLHKADAGKWLKGAIA